MSIKSFWEIPLPGPTFDGILPEIEGWFRRNPETLNSLMRNDDDWLLVNRDLNGRVRLILPDRFRVSEKRQDWDSFAMRLLDCLGKHAYPKAAQIIFEADFERARQGATSYPLQGFPKVWIVDRLATEANWSHIEPEAEGSQRVVFFSIKGGVGRSTALAASAWSLAQAGKRVLVLDLDLESPGLSSALLPAERQPMYGITDWLVEDLVDNGDTVLENMVATSNLSHDGDIHVVPAHGASHGEYISKLGRVWMPKVHEDGTREIWSARLVRLIKALEVRIQPDVVLIDSRSGIDEIASACITDIGANLILLFALDGEQTWNGYRMLFEQWQRAHVAEKIRERLRVVGALVPELDRISYLEGLRESAHGVFSDTLYDEIAPVDPAAIGPGTGDHGKWRVDAMVEGWNFDEADEGAPHYPWAVNWHRSFAGLRSLQGRLVSIDVQEVQAVFGSLIGGVSDAIDSRNSS